MVVASSIVSNTSVPPELVDQAGVGDHKRIVELVIMADVGSNRSPHEFPVRISSKSGCFGWFAD